MRRRDELRGKGRSADRERSAFRILNFLIDALEQNFGEEARGADANGTTVPAPIYARINRLKISAEEFFRSISEYGTDAGPSGFRSPDERLPIDALAADTATSRIRAQPSPASCSIRSQAKMCSMHARRLAGKLRYLARANEKPGPIVACDRDDERMQNAAGKFGSSRGRRLPIAHNIDWTSGEACRTAAAIAPFDRILVDAPCSNTGVMRRRVDVRWRLQPERFFADARTSNSQFCARRSRIAQTRRHIGLQHVQPRTGRK